MAFIFEWVVHIFRLYIGHKIDPNQIVAIHGANADFVVMPYEVLGTDIRSFPE